MSQPTFTYTVGPFTYGTDPQVPADLRGTTVQEYHVYMDGRHVIVGTGSEQDAQAEVARLVAGYAPTQVTFADGSVVTMEQRTADTVIGLSDEGYLVVPTDYGGAIALTPCCHASGTGEMESETGVACRSCYQDVDSVHGDSHVLVHIPVA